MKRDSMKIVTKEVHITNHLGSFWKVVVQGKKWGAFCNTRYDSYKMYKTKELARRSLNRFIKKLEKEIA